MKTALILTALLGVASTASATPAARAAVIDHLKLKGLPTAGVSVRTTKTFPMGTEQVVATGPSGKMRFSVGPRGRVTQRGKTIAPPEAERTEAPRQPRSRVVEVLDYHGSTVVGGHTEVLTGDDLEHFERRATGLDELEKHGNR